MEGLFFSELNEEFSKNEEVAYIEGLPSVSELA
jgi:hypothetical protein